MTQYELSRRYFDWCFENPELICPVHTAIYFFAIEHCNRLGWKDKFGFPSQMTMEALGIKKHQTYIKYFRELVNFGFIKLIQESKNQYSANIISVQTAMPENGKALDKALIKHGAKQTESMGQSKVPVIKQITNNNKQLNNILLSEIKISDVPEIEKQFFTIALSFQNIIENYLAKLKIKSTAKHKYSTWIYNIRLMFENDKRTVEEFREVAEYLKNEIPDNNGFSWQANIRSADTLRKHFEKVLIKSRQMKLAKKESSTYRKTIEPNLMEV